jgi:hypothetical protein
MLIDTSDNLKLLNSINFADSALDGFSIDLFKVTILVCVVQTEGLHEFGLDPDNCGGANFAFHFRGVRSLSLMLDNIRLPEAPYLDDGALAAVNLGDFHERFSLTEVGQYGLTARGDPVPVYEITVGINEGQLKFQFTALDVEQYRPEDLDTRAKTWKRQASMKGAF